MHTVHEYQLANAVDLASALTRAVTSALHAAITARGRASLVVSGGRTPVLLFNQLAQQQLDWRRVVITLADERWVRADATTSNENLVRRELLRDHAVAAQFVGMMSAADTLASGAEAAWRALATIPRPFDCVLLGMGDDGHTASLFPTATLIDDALDPARPPACVAMQAPVAPYQRISLNLAALLESRHLVLLIQGATKWTAYQTARAPGLATALPMRAVLHQSVVPVDVFWSP